MLESLTIENFRGFEKLELTGLRRVNLIVGKNNVGKTTLLEALTLVTNPDAVQTLPDVFRSNAPADENFFRWLLRDGAAGPASIEAVDEIGKRKFAFKAKVAAHTAGIPLAWLTEKAGFTFHALQSKALKVHAVSVQQRDLDGLVSAFAKLMRSPGDETQFTAILKQVDPRIVSLRLDVLDDSSKPFIAVDIGLRDRTPLSQVGQGIHRLVSIFSELYGKRPDVCFIDEIENGIHYSAFPTLWRGIAEVAQKLGIQVFATTHSRECLQAAHEVFEERAALGEAYELGVIQLYRTDAGVTGRVLQEKHLDAAVTSDIELR